MDADSKLAGVVQEGVSVEVKAGDVVYYELGADIDRNFQNMHVATVTLTTAASDTPVQPATLQ